MALDANAYRAGEEHFSGGDEYIEKARSIFSHTHLPEPDRVWLRETTHKLLAISKRKLTSVDGGRYHAAKTQRFLDAQRRLLLNYN